MITGVGSIAVLVNDGKKSAEWYREKLGFEVVMAQDHLVFVKPETSEGPLLHLCAKCDDWGTDRPGGRTGVWLRCGEVTLRRDEKSGAQVLASPPNDVEMAYHELKKRGVDFTQELTTTSWGKLAIFKDLDGNEFEIS